MVLIRENALSIFCRHNVAPSRKTVLLSPLLGLTVSCCRCHHHHFAEKKQEQGKLHRPVYLVYILDCKYNIVQDSPGNVQDCQRLSKIVQDFARLSKIVLDCPRLSRIVQDCSGLSIFLAKMHLAVPPAHIMLHLCTFHNLVCKKFFEHPLKFPKILESYIPFIQN